MSRHGINANSIVGSTTVSTSMTWAPATDDLSGVASYWLLRSVNGGGWQTITSTTTSRIARLSMVFGSSYRFRLRAEDKAGNIGPSADGPAVQASLVQEGTSLARYTGSWSSRSDSSASGRKVRTTTSAGASVEFTFTARAVGIVAPKGSTRGRVKVYVDGVYVRTVDLYRSSTQARVVVFAQSWEASRPASGQARDGRHVRPLQGRYRWGRLPQVGTVNCPGTWSSSTGRAAAARDSSGPCR